MPQTPSKPIFRSFKDQFKIDSDDIQSFSSSPPKEILETPSKCLPSSENFVYFSNRNTNPTTQRLLTKSRFEGISSMNDKGVNDKQPMATTFPSTFNELDNHSSPYSNEKKMKFDDLAISNSSSDDIMSFKPKKKKLVRKGDILQRTLLRSLNPSPSPELDYDTERFSNTSSPCSHSSFDDTRIDLESKLDEPSSNEKKLIFSPSSSSSSSSPTFSFSSPINNSLVEEKMKKLDSVIYFFNSATLQDLMNQTQCSSTQAELLISLRPFSDYSHLTSIFQSTKHLSMKLIDTYLSIMESMNVLDSLVSKCNAIQSTFDQRIQSWPSELSQPSGLMFPLKSYQCFGVAWLYMVYEERLSGAILADDMGLGKTAQVIGLIALLLNQSVPGPHLIICPASTVEHWMREFETWLPECSTFLYHGTQSERSLLQYDIKALSPNVVITAYNIASGSKLDRVFLKKMKFNLVVLDEGHKVKNSESQTTRHLARLPSRFRLLLTGTPLQNNLQELVSLLAFILPEFFRGQDEWQKILNLKSIDSVSQQLIEKVKSLMQPFILRRKKIQVLNELPPKHVRVIDCPLESDQLEFYRSIQTEAFHDTTSEQRIQHYLMTLRKAAAHPLLFRRLFTDARVYEMAKKLLREEPFWDATVDRLNEDLLVMSDFQLHQLALKYKSVHPFALRRKEWMESAKLIKLTPLLQSFHENGDRCLIFSQFTMCLDILETYLTDLNYKYVRLDGSTPIEDRQWLVDEYNENPEIFIFLISTRAGGLGINLTTANVVIMHDLDFNPHNDTQAEDRTWRLGQKKPVQVLKLVCKDTVEEIMYNRQLAKLDLDHRITNDDDSRLLTDENFKADFLKHVSLK